ncbi:MAG TPA: sulfurtransferase [Vicinamibacterales bacterium]|nr:sulfurtransferase [Vicinamibacterales bacterium]
MKGYANAQLLITPLELSSLLGQGGTKSPLVLDLRPPEAYTAGHIPGAIHLDLWGVSLIDTDPAPLKAFMWMIEHVLAAHGVNSNTPVVVYDDRSGMRAARAFWFLEYFGHPNVRLLDGGFTAWTAGGFDVTRDAGPPPPQSTPEWTGQRNEHTLATWREVRNALGRPDAVILDTRSEGEYCGTAVRARRGGAIPGAVHIEWTRNLSPEGDFKPAGELKTMYEDAGVTPDREVLTYCQGGYRAAHSYLALRLLGYPRVRTYVGSWKEWGDRDELPVEIPKRN